MPSTAKQLSWQLSGWLLSQGGSVYRIPQRGVEQGGNGVCSIEHQEPSTKTEVSVSDLDSSIQLRLDYKAPRNLSAPRYKNIHICLTNWKKNKNKNKETSKTVSTSLDQTDWLVFISHQICSLQAEQKALEIQSLF